MRDHRGAAFIRVWKDLAGLAVQVGSALRQALLGLVFHLCVEHRKILYPLNLGSLASFLIRTP
jgi:hypothetical protein